MCTTGLARRQDVGELQDVGKHFPSADRPGRKSRATWSNHRLSRFLAGRARRLSGARAGAKADRKIGPGRN